MYDSRTGFFFLRMIEELRNPIEVARRRIQARSCIEERISPLSVNETLGYRFISPDELSGLTEVLFLLDSIVEEARPHLDRIVESQPGRFRIAFDLLSDVALSRCPELVDFVLQADVLDAVIEYLGTVPSLRRIALAHSPVALPNTQPADSQLFHLDGENDRQLKLFVNVKSVGEQDGPFSFVPADRSSEILRKIRPAEPQMGRHLRAGPFADDVIARYLDEGDFMRLTGPPGTALLVDTSRCLHFGSRVRSSRGRFVFVAALRSYACVHETPYNSFDPELYADDPVRKSVLTHRKPVRPGWFFPDPIENPGPANRGRRG